jgi:hypothetical protein
MTNYILSGREDADHAGQLARDLNRILMLALTDSDDGHEVTDWQAWKDAQVGEVLSTAHRLIGRMLRRLEAS